MVNLRKQSDLQVIVADNYFTGSKDSLRKWIGHPRFELIRHDVTEPLLVEVDQIYHLACPASPIFYKHNPVKLKEAIWGTILGWKNPNLDICFIKGTEMTVEQMNEVRELWSLYCVKNV